MAVPRREGGIQRRTGDIQRRTGGVQRRARFVKGRGSNLAHLRRSGAGLERHFGRAGRRAAGATSSPAALGPGSVRCLQRDLVRVR
eukprot:scaffold109983_cov36-Phaeocystis_antarctica.AAC.1